MHGMHGMHRESAQPAVSTPHWRHPRLLQVFSEFAGRKPVKEVSPDDPDTYMGSGDVKYHLGTSYDRPTISGELGEVRVL